MTFNKRIETLESKLVKPHTNPFVEGTHAHFVRLSWGADSDATPKQWIEDTTTGERFEVTAEWKRLLDSYHKEQSPNVPVRFVWSLAPPPTSE